MADAVLTLRSLSFAYGARKALDDVSFTVPRGRVTVLLGPNGAGKSTLMTLIAGLLAPPLGTITVLGHDMARAPRRALAQTGIVFQQPTLDLDLTVAQNLRVFAALHGLGRRIAEPRIAEELARLEMAERAGDTVRTLNGGHRRRVEIARALLHRPTLLLLDEPTVGLDVPTRARLVDHVHALARDEGLAVLWTTHLIDEVDTAADQVVVLHRGRVRAAAPVAEILCATGAADLSAAFARLTDDGDEDAGGSGQGPPGRQAPPPALAVVRGAP
ncbi:ABC transporter ATP-binding protein [Caenispirillum bisanense]|uniref:ABC transporter ATP-binding protein n=1 Tax=Caenispirillum bisanense TaxID=414052 RepID=UPI0031DDC47D